MAYQDRSFDGIVGRSKLLLSAGELDMSVDEAVVAVDVVLGHLCRRLRSLLESIDASLVVETH